jgi:hypothetical protein
VYLTFRQIGSETPGEHHAGLDRPNLIESRDPLKRQLHLVHNQNFRSYLTVNKLCIHYITERNQFKVPGEKSLFYENRKKK